MTKMHERCRPWMTVKDYVLTRSTRDPEFAEGFESGYQAFKIGALLRQARERARLTQDEVARRLNTQRSVISRMENRSGDIRLSTLERYAHALGWTVALELRPLDADRHELA